MALTANELQILLDTQKSAQAAAQQAAEAAGTAKAVQLDCGAAFKRIGVLEHSVTTLQTRQEDCPARNGAQEPNKNARAANWLQVGAIIIALAGVLIALFALLK